MANPNFFANGDINPCRFVKNDSTAGKNFYVVECGATTDRPNGISQEGSHDTPGLSGSSTLAAAQGDQLTVHGQGKECLLQVAGTTVPGDLLGPDANGKGDVLTANPAGATSRWVGARALQHGSADEKIRVEVINSYIIET